MYMELLHNHAMYHKFICLNNLYAILCKHNFSNYLIKINARFELNRKHSFCSLDGYIFIES